MTSEEFVGRADQEVAVDSLHIDRAVGGVMDGVHVDPGPNCVGHRGDTPHVVDGAHRVGGVAHRHQPRPLVDEPFQPIHIQGAIGRVEVGVADHDPSLLQGQPGGDVGIVVQPGDDDLVARAQFAANGPAYAEGKGRHVGAEDDLVRRGSVEKIGHGLVRFGDDLVGALAGGEGAVDVGIGTGQVVGHGIDHCPRHLGAARAVEVDEGPPRLVSLTQGRELVA